MDKTVSGEVHGSASRSKGKGMTYEVVHDTAEAVSIALRRPCKHEHYSLGFESEWIL